MGLISKILTGGASELINSVGSVIDQFHLSGEEKQTFKLKLEELLQKRDSEIEQTIRSELDAKSRIIESEMMQGDKFTKRARPMLVYTGLFFIFLNYCVIPLASSIWGTQPMKFDLPAEFWMAWGGTVSIWSFGRSMEKRGVRSGLVDKITGKSSVMNRLLED